jgi:AcrR family transcriptional regulator
MVTTRNTRDDVVRAAGRLFAERGYHGTSMRDLGRELGLLGSSLYSHVASKQDLLVEVVEEGARLFEVSADRALAIDGAAGDRLRALISGHVDVVIDNIEVSRTFLNEAKMLDAGPRSRIVAARDHYEGIFRSVIREGIEEGSIGEDVDPKTTSIFILSILNAIERWYDPRGQIDRDALVDRLTSFVESALSR